jgi:hypothetical protein
MQAIVHYDRCMLNALSILMNIVCINETRDVYVACDIIFILQVTPHL